MLTDRLYFETVCLTILTDHGEKKSCYNSFTQPTFILTARCAGCQDMGLRRLTPLEPPPEGRLKTWQRDSARKAKKMLIGRLLADTCNDTGKIFQQALA